LKKHYFLKKIQFFTPKTAFSGYSFVAIQNLEKISCNLDTKMAEFDRVDQKL